MVDFALTPKQIEIQNQVADIAAGYCSEEQERTADKTGDFQEDVFQALAKCGLLTLWRGAAQGKGGMLDGCILSEAMAKSSASAASLVFVSGISAAIMERGGGPLADQLLSGLETGKLKFAFGLTESSAGSDVTALTTYAENRNGSFIINGAKRFTSGAREADYILTVARSGDRDRKRPGLSIIAVPANSEGLTIEPLDKISGNSHACCNLTFKDLVVSAENLIGPEDNAWGILYMGGLIDRLSVAASAIGIAQRAYEETVSYLRQRQSAGRSVTDYQAIQHQLVNMAMKLNAMRSTAYHAAWKADSGADATADINMAKIFCVETGNQIITDAFRLYGGTSYLNEATLYRLWRDSSLGFFAGGTVEIARNAAAKGLGL